LLAGTDGGTLRFHGGPIFFNITGNYDVYTLAAEQELQHPAAKVTKAKNPDSLTHSFPPFGF
jgi:hypothetical protein